MPHESKQRSTSFLWNSFGDISKQDELGTDLVPVSWLLSDRGFERSAKGLELLDREAGTLSPC